MLSEKQNTFNKNKTFIDNSSENISKTEAKIKSLTDEISALTEENKSLEKIGEEIGVTIRCQRAEIFEKMHRL